MYTYDSTGTGVGIRNNISANKNFMLRPNPNRGEFNIFFGSEVNTNLQYKVFDLLGREVRSGNYRSEYGMNNIPVNISDLANGVYILNVFDATNMLYKQKVIKD